MEGIRMANVSFERVSISTPTYRNMSTPSFVRWFSTRVNSQILSPLLSQAVSLSGERKGGVERQIKLTRSRPRRSGLARLEAAPHKSLERGRRTQAVPGEWFWSVREGFGAFPLCGWTDGG
jgi:hypothetical protein